MKLVEKYNRQLLLLLIGILIPLIIVLLFSINYINNTETKEFLDHQIEILALDILDRGSTHSLYPSYEIKEVSLPLSPATYSEVELYDQVEEEEETFLQVQEVRLINGRHYQLIARTSSLEKEELLLGIVVAIVLFGVVLLILLNYLNTNLTNKLWLPFNNYLEQLKTFSFRDHTHIAEVQTEVDEFKELGVQLKKMTQKLSSDYQNLRQFSENASHEIQTPLSIIRTKVVEILGTDLVDTLQAEKLSIIYKATNRLSRINQSLIILSRIENRQYHDEKIIDFGILIKEQLDFLIESKILKKGDIEFSQKNSCEVLMSKTLAEVMINNLIKNILTHSTSSLPIGEIEIDFLEIKFSNAGQNSIRNIDKLFQRFYKETSNANSSGLGLSIVSSICQYYAFRLTYRFEKGQHIFTVNIGNSES